MGASTHGRADAAVIGELTIPVLRTFEFDDVWQPFATQVAAWCDAWSAWLEDKPLVDQLTAAHQWLKENDLRLKNERLAPIEDSARSAWARCVRRRRCSTGAPRARRTSLRTSASWMRVCGG